MLYLCRFLHFTEDNRKGAEYIHCDGCHRNIHKSDTIKFGMDKNNGMYYMRRPSKPIAQNKKYTRDTMIYHQRYQMEYRKMKKLQTVGKSGITAHAVCTEGLVAPNRDSQSQSIPNCAVLTENNPVFGDGGVKSIENTLST